MLCLGAFVPLVPFFFASRRSALITSVVLNAIVLPALGAAVTTLTGRPPLRSAIRQLLFGLDAAAITYAIGRAVGRVVCRVAAPGLPCLTAMTARTCCMAQAVPGPRTTTTGQCA
jgi:hypothetical protein